MLQNNRAETVLAHHPGPNPKSTFRGGTIMSYSEIIIKCKYCKKHDDPSKMINKKGGKQFYHKDCSIKYSKEYYKRKNNVRCANVQIF